MPATSKAQQRFMGIVHAIQKGDAKASDYSKEIKVAAKGMKKKDVKDYADTDQKGLPDKVSEAGGVITARIQQKPRGYWAVFNKKGEAQFEGNKRFMINILKKASTLSPNAIGSILDRARPGGKHLEFKAQFSRYYFDESVKEDRDYKDEYKKFQSSTKAKKYRAELNQYNRKKGTYGNNDGKDASHKGGNIVGFESQSKNRGRAEKSRLKKEAISKDEWAQYPKYARKLKPYMKKLLKVPIRVRVIKQANHNPWIEVRVARFGKDIIPNDFRKRALKAIGGGKPRDMDNINYGNITTNSVSMKHDQWVKVLGNKVKSESVSESGILYRAGVKKYGKEGMRKIQQAAGKRKSHAVIGAIKDKYEKKKKESVDEAVKFDSIQPKDTIDYGYAQYYVAKNDGKNIHMGLVAKKKAIGGMFASNTKLSKSNFASQIKVKFIKRVLRNGKPLKESVNEEIMNWLGGYDDEFKFKKGHLVKDINPNCPHVGSEGVVTKVTKDEVTYTVRNNGRTYKVGDELTKTKDQLTPLSVEFVTEAVNYSKIPTKKLVKVYKQMADERLSGAAVITFRTIAKELIKRKAKLEGGKDCCDNCKEGKPCCSVESVNEAKVLKFTDIKDRTLEKHLKVVTKKVGAELKKISGGFQVGGTIKALTAVVDYIFVNSKGKRLMTGKNQDYYHRTRGGGMSKVNLVNEAKTINVEPNWEGMWRFFKRMAKTNPRDWKKMERKLGSEWFKIDKMAQQKGWKSESVNESTKRQYRDVYYKYYKTYEAFAREVMNLTKRISKISGDKVDAKIILKNFKKHVIPFAGLMNSWSKGRESNPHIDESINEATGVHIKLVDSITRVILSGRHDKTAYDRLKMILKKRDSLISGKQSAGVYNQIYKELFNGLYSAISKVRKKYKLESVDEGFGSPELMGKKDLAEFEKTRQKNAEVLGYKLTGQTDIKPIKEKSKVTK